MSEMVKRVARAIWFLNEDTDCPDYDQLAPFAKKRADQWSRAAITAMREPTAEMLNNTDTWGDIDAWHKLIDEALK